MELVFNYYRKDVFRNWVFTSDGTSFVKEADINKVFNLFKKDPMSAIHLVLKGEETYSFTWEHYDDCENGVVTMIYSKQWNIRDIGKQMTITKAKKMAKDLMKEFSEED